MADSRPSPIGTRPDLGSRPVGASLTDLLCVAVLGLFLALGARAIGDLTRSAAPLRQSEPATGHAVP